MDERSTKAAVFIQAYWRGYWIRKYILQTRSEYEEIVREIESEAGIDYNERETVSCRWLKDQTVCYPRHSNDDKMIDSNVMAEPLAERNYAKELPNVEKKRVDNNVFIGSSSKPTALDPNSTVGDELHNYLDTFPVFQNGSFIKTTNCDKSTTTHQQMAIHKNVDQLFQHHTTFSEQASQADLEQPQNRLLTESWMSVQSLDDVITTTDGNENTNSNNKVDLLDQQKELMLEMIWLQQAIHSRKVYLGLKMEGAS